MAQRKLAAVVYVDGVAYGPDNQPPADVADQITNPKAWGEEPDADGGTKKAPAKKAAASKSEK